MTWTEFNTIVKEFLTVDAERLGSENFLTRQIRAAVIDIQTFIPLYRVAHQNFYTASDAGAVGACSSFSMPDGAEMLDAYIVRYKSPSSAIDGTTTASNTTTITGVGTSFTTALEVGDYIALSSAATTWGIVTEIHSDTELKVNRAMGDGTTQTILRQIRYEYACDPWAWGRRKELTNRDLSLEQRGLITVSPGGDEFLVLPAIQSLDADGFTYQLELNWNGIKTEFADNDTVPFDEAVAGAVADWVKGECARHLDHDLSAWQTFFGGGKMVGTYYLKRQSLYLNARNRSLAR